MKHFLITALICATLATFMLTGCASQPDYTLYISEKRSEIYLYSDDDIDIKINCVAKEQPFNTDGICGSICNLVEIFVSFRSTPAEVEISLDDYSGEMNYEAVERRFTASYTHAAYRTDGLDVTISADGKKKIYRVLSVLDSGVMSCEQILNCAMEHDKELFASLTKGKDFLGEIFIRLLYDEGCYFYVGVCDRDKNITAYLLDGGVGKVIASKKYKG